MSEEASPPNSQETQLESADPVPQIDHAPVSQVTVQSDEVQNAPAPAEPQRTEPVPAAAVSAPVNEVAAPPATTTGPPPARTLFGTSAPRIEIGRRVPPQDENLDQPPAELFEPENPPTAQEVAPPTQALPQTTPQATESSQVEDVQRSERPSESQSEERMDTSVNESPPDGGHGQPSRPMDTSATSSDDDDSRPTRKVVIDETEDAENSPQKVQETRAPANPFPYEDHNYFLPSNQNQRNQQLEQKQPIEEPVEKFPVIGDLAEYLGEKKEQIPAPAPPVQQTTPQQVQTLRPMTRVQQSPMSHYTGHDYTSRTIGGPGQTIHTVRMVGPRASSVGAPSLTSYRPVSGERTIPVQTIQARRIMGPTTAPTLITRRPTLIRARRDGDNQPLHGNVIIRTTPEGIRVRAPTHVQSTTVIGSPLYHSTPIAASNVVSQPAGAPAPFITARGTRIALRGRPSQPLVRPTRIARERTESGQILGPDGHPHGTPQYVQQGTQMVTSSTGTPTQVTISPRKLVPMNASGQSGQVQGQPVYVSQIQRRPTSASPAKIVPRSGLTYRQVQPSPPKPKDAGLVSVVDEEELQNMQFLQQQESKKAEAQARATPTQQQEGQGQVQSHEQAQLQEQHQDAGKIPGRSPTSAAIELTRLRTSNVPVSTTPEQVVSGQQISTDSGTTMVSEDGRTLVRMRPVMTRGRGVRLAQPGQTPYPQGQRLPLSRTTNVNLDSLRPGLEYSRGPYGGVRFSSTPGTRIVSRSQGMATYGGQPVQVVRGSPTHQVVQQVSQTQATQLPPDHEYTMAPPQQVVQSTSQPLEVSQAPPQEHEAIQQQAPITTQVHTVQQPPTSQVQIQQTQLPPQTQHFRVIDTSVYSSRSPPRPMTPGTRVVHLQPYSPQRQRISSSGLEDLAQVVSQQPQVLQSGQHAVYPIPMTSPPRQYRTVAYQPYGQRTSSPPKQQFQPVTSADGTRTYLEPQPMQQIPQPPPEQPQPPQDFLAAEHPEQQLPSMEQIASMQEVQRVPEAYPEHQLLYQQPEEQKLPTDIDMGQEGEGEQKLPEPKEEDEEEEEDEESEEDEWKDQDYVNRCLCGLTHNDDFMLECERCNVWQHGVCMGVNQKRVPKNYFCEKCEPRTLKHTQEEATAIQRRYLDQKKKIKERQKRLKKERAAKKQQARQAKKSVEPEPKKRTMSSGSVKSTKKFVLVAENEYSRKMKTFMNATPHKGEMSLPTGLPEVDPSARQMYVAPNVEGLVATRIIPQGQPVIEYRGKVGFMEETNGREKIGSVQNFVIVYNGFGTNEEMAVVVDARKIGSPARYARKSCRPNTTMNHVIRYGKLHLFLIATEDIDFSAEITIPFDFDWRYSTTPLECACGEAECPVKEFNASLSDRLPAAAEEPKKELNGVIAAKKPALLPKKTDKTGQKPKSLVKTTGSGLPKAVSVSPGMKKKLKKGKVTKNSKNKGKLKLKPPKRSESRSTRAEEKEKDEKKGKVVAEKEVEEKEEEERPEAPTTRARNKKEVEAEPPNEEEPLEPRRSTRTRTSSITVPGPSSELTKGAVPEPKEEIEELKKIEKEEKEVKRATRKSNASETNKRAKTKPVVETLMTPESEKTDRDLQRALEQIRRLEEEEKKRKEKEASAKKKSVTPKGKQDRSEKTEKPSPVEKSSSKAKTTPKTKQEAKKAGKGQKVIEEPKEEEDEHEEVYTSVAERLRRSSRTVSASKHDEAPKEMAVKEEEEKPKKTAQETPRRSGRLSESQSPEKKAKAVVETTAKESPAKRRKLDKEEPHQMSQVDAATILAEMALSTSYDEKLTIPQISPTAEKSDVPTQIRRLAQAEQTVLEQVFELKDSVFVEPDEPSTSSSYPKSASRGTSLLQKALANNQRSSQRLSLKPTGKQEAGRPKTPPPTPRTPEIEEAPEAAVTPVEHPKPKAVKKLSLSDYKKRRESSQNANNTEATTPKTADVVSSALEKLIEKNANNSATDNKSPVTTKSPPRKSFIPTFTELKDVPENLNMVLPPSTKTAAPSIQDLKKKILGGTSSIKEKSVKSPPHDLASTSSDSSEPASKRARLTPPPPPPNLEQSSQLEPGEIPPNAPPAPAAVSVPHRMSLEERLRAEFGIGVGSDDGHGRLGGTLGGGLSVLPPPPPPPPPTTTTTRNERDRPPPPPPPPASQRPQRTSGMNSNFRQGQSGIVYDMNDIPPPPPARTRQPTHRYARM